VNFTVIQKNYKIYNHIFLGVVLPIEEVDASAPVMQLFEIHQCEKSVILLAHIVEKAKVSFVLILGFVVVIVENGLSVVAEKFVIIQRYHDLVGFFVSKILFLYLRLSIESPLFEAYLS
jgi:hypothetical protein